MNRRHGFLALALTGLVGAAAFWLVTGPPPDGPQEAPIERAAGGTAATPAEVDAAPTLESAPPSGKAPRVDSGESSRERGSIVARVRDVDGKPIARAAVRVWNSAATSLAETATDGTARFTGLAVADVILRADAEGFAGEEQEIGVKANEETVAEFTLESGVPFDGVVLDALDEKPVAQASVAVAAGGSVGGMLSASARSPYDRTRSDAEGRFRVRGVPEGEVATLQVRARGYAEGRTSVRVLGGSVTPSPVVVRLAAGGRITGVVRDPKGTPVEGATIYVMRTSQTDLRKNPRLSFWSTDGGHAAALRAVSGEGGLFVLEGLPLDIEYVAVADAERFARSEEAMGLLLHRNRLEAEADLTLRARASIVVRVVDLHGRPVTEPAQVMLGGPMDGHRKAGPDDGNHYRFDGVNPGEWPVSVESASFRPGEAIATAEAGKATEVVVRLDPGASVEGMIVDEEGRSVEDAMVEVGAVAANPEPAKFEFLMDARSTRSDAKGWFAVRGLPPVESFVQARRIPRLDVPQMRTKERLRLTPSAAEVRLVLVRLGRVTVRLMRPDGAPYAGPAYVWRGLPGSREGTGTSTEDGRIRFDGLEDGEHHLQVDVEGFAPFRRKVAARVRSEIDLGEVVLDAGITATGRVTDLSGAPIPGARVSADDRNEVAADPGGAFTLDHLPTGVTRVEASADGFLASEQNLDVRKGLGPVVFRLARGALVRATVKAADGRPTDDVHLVAILLGADGVPIDKGAREWEAPNEEGRVSWRLPAGRWRIALGEKQGEEYAEVPLGEWAVAEGEVRDLELVLPAR